MEFRNAERNGPPEADPAEAGRGCRANPRGDAILKTPSNLRIGGRLLWWCPHGRGIRAEVEDRHQTPRRGVWSSAPRVGAHQL